MTEEINTVAAKSAGAAGRKGNVKGGDIDGGGKDGGGKNKNKGAGRPKSDNPKVQLSIRLDRDVVEAFKAGGDGWQSRINRVLKQTIAPQAPR